MAKGLTYKRSTVESLSVKGILNEDATTITYIDDEKAEQTVTIASLMEKFCSMPIEFGVKVKSEEELDIEDEDEDEEVDIDELTADKED